MFDNNKRIFRIDNMNEPLACKVVIEEDYDAVKDALWDCRDRFNSSSTQANLHWAKHPYDNLIHGGFTPLFFIEGIDESTNDLF